MVQDCLLEKKLSEQEGGLAFWSGSTHKHLVYSSGKVKSPGVPCLASPPHHSQTAFS